MGKRALCQYATILGEMGLFDSFREFYVRFLAHFHDSTTVRKVGLKLGGNINTNNYALQRSIFFPSRKRISILFGTITVFTTPKPKTGCFTRSPALNFPSMSYGMARSSSM